MPSSSFQKQWNDRAKRYGLRVEIPFVVAVGDQHITVPVLLRDFGPRLGMLLVTDFGLISAYADDLIELGYGYSCLSEPSGVVDPQEDASVVAMLADWGWAGSGSPPAWYGDRTSQK